MTGDTNKLSDAQLSAMRAQAYPDILNDDGIEWKIAKITDLEKQLADTMRDYKKLEDFSSAQDDIILNLGHENERLRNAIGNLEPIKDEDWHGKWRIQKCLAALRNRESDNG